MNNNLWTAFENRSLPRAWFQNKNWVWICTFCTSHIFQLAWHGSSAQICRRSEESDGGMAWMAWMAWAVATWLRISLDLHCFALFGLWCHSCIIIIIFIGILVMFLEKEKQASGLRRVQLLSKVDPLLTHSWPFSHIFAEGLRAKGQRDALKAVSTLSLVILLLFCDVLCMMPSTRSPWHVHNKSERIQMYSGYISNCFNGWEFKGLLLWGLRLPTSEIRFSWNSGDAKRKCKAPRVDKTFIWVQLSSNVKLKLTSIWCFAIWTVWTSQKTQQLPKAQNPVAPSIGSKHPLQPSGSDEAATEPQSRCALYDRCMLCVKLCALWVSFCIIYLAKLI